MHLMKRGKFLIISLFAAAGLFLVSTTARAYPVTFYFEGDITSVDSDLSGLLNNTQTISGYYTFQSDAPAYSSGSNYAYYYANGLKATVKEGSTEAYSFESTGTDTDIEVANDSPVKDAYEVYSHNGTGTPLPEYLFNTFSWQISDLDKNVFTDTSLPTTPPDLTKFEVNIFDLYLEIVDDDEYEAQGNITKLYMVEDQLPGTPPTQGVPEPSTLLLIGTGLVGLVIRGKKKIRK